MGRLPRAVTRAILEQPEHLPAALAWARRLGLELRFDEEELALELNLTGPGATTEAPPEPYRISGLLEDFDVLPIIWRYVDPRSGANIGVAAYPRPTGSSVLHGNGLICAPWSRLAYAVEGGIHSDWQDLTDWKTPRPPYTFAPTIADQLDRLYRETRASTGRMAALPVAA